MSFISARRARVGQECHLSAVLHRDSDVALVLRAVAGDATRADLATIGDELAEQVRVLVVDVGGLVLAELTDLLLQLANDGLGHRGAPVGASPSTTEGMVVRIGELGWDSRVAG